jgi:UDP-N-acetylglucosamine 2-epimerase (non-hydrolysing)
VSRFRILLVAGTRPNFIKVAPVMRALAPIPDLQMTLVHTGQHYDGEMSGAFMSALEIAPPDFNLEVGSGSHALQTARIMERIEPVLLGQSPSAAMVFGDVNSTAACALVAVKLGVPVAHVEAGLRSFDRGMPEEINRVVTDALSELLLVSEPSGTANLLNEGKDRRQIHEVGNVMIDSLRWIEPRARALRPWERFDCSEGGYGLATLHRPSNVDDPAILKRIMDCLDRLSRELPMVLPLHPRTRARLRALAWSPSGDLRLVDPLPYIESIALQSAARLILTDSGGVQEEASCLGVPCLCLRWNTERPVAVELGTVTLVGNDPERIEAAFRQILDGRYKRGGPIPLWDGRAAERVAAAVSEWLGLPAQGAN